MVPQDQLEESVPTAKKRPSGPKENCSVPDDAIERLGRYSLLGSYVVLGTWEVGY